MSVRQILKWLFIISIATILINGLLYFALESKQLLIGIYGAIGLGTISGIGTLMTKAK